MFSSGCISKTLSPLLRFNSAMIRPSKALMFIDIFLIPVAINVQVRLCQFHSWTLNLKNMK